MNSLINQKGQVMLLSVLLIGGSILIFSTIAGYSMLLRIRASSFSADSAKAVFAADAGIECELYRFNFADPKNPKSVNCNNLKFEDDRTSVETSIVYDASGVPLYIKSIGSAGDSKRAFIMKFEGATTLVP
jgi:uncharacterized protein (UPF0333 family)